MRTRTVILALALVLGACAEPSEPTDAPNEPTDPTDPGFQETSFSDFSAAFDSGADCPELYEVRNDMDPNDPNADEVNEMLRSVGCFTSTATRED